MLSPKREMEDILERVYRGDISLEKAEAEIAFWIEVDDCDMCKRCPGFILCSHHYDAYFYGWGADFDR